MLKTLVFILLLLSNVAYIIIAKHFNIIDKPNERNLHKTITIRGAGIIYWIAGLAYFIYSDFLYIY